MQCHDAMLKINQNPAGLLAQTFLSKSFEIISELRINHYLHQLLIVSIISANNETS